MENLNTLIQFNGPLALLEIDYTSLHLDGTVYDETVRQQFDTQLNGPLIKDNGTWMESQQLLHKS